MKPSTLFLIAIAFVFLLWKGCYHPKFPEIATNYLSTFDSSEESGELKPTPKPCAGKDYCVYIYLAAWCPHCRDLIQNIQQYRNFWRDGKRPGLIVIVGNDKKAAIESMAMSVGVPVFLDSEDKFRKKFHINFFPYFMVVDRDKHIIASKQGGMTWVDQEINSHLK